MRTILIIFAFLFYVHAEAGEQININGIWADQNIDGDYYSIQQKGETIVLIDLSRIVDTNNVLSATYFGHVDDLLLNPVGVSEDYLGGIPVSIEITGARTAIIFLQSESIGIIARNIMKIY